MSGGGGTLDSSGAAAAALQVPGGPAEGCGGSWGGVCGGIYVCVFPPRPSSRPTTNLSPAYRTTVIGTAAAVIGGVVSALMI